MINSRIIWTFLFIAFVTINNTFSQTTLSENYIPIIEYKLDSSDYYFADLKSPITVKVKFSVDHNGEFRNVKAKRITCVDCDKETKKHFKKLAVDIITSSPKWEIEDNNDAKPKSVTFFMPIKFVPNE